MRRMTDFLILFVTVHVRVAGHCRRRIVIVILWLSYRRLLSNKTFSLNNVTELFGIGEWDTHYNGIIVAGSRTIITGCVRSLVCFHLMFSAEATWTSPEAALVLEHVLRLWINGPVMAFARFTKRHALNNCSIGKTRLFRCSIRWWQNMQYTFGILMKHSFKLRLWRTEFFQPIYVPRKKSYLKLHKADTLEILFAGYNPIEEWI